MRTMEHFAQKSKDFTIDNLILDFVKLAFDLRGDSVAAFGDFAESQI